LQQEADAAGVKGFRAEELVDRVVRDPESAPLPEKEKALLRFVDKVNQHSQEITAADMQPLYAAGWTDEAIYYAITICALFNFYNRWVDAGGVPALSDEAHRQGGKRMAASGYERK
jgi:alkylhydroperoxidase family enzyme